MLGVHPNTIRAWSDAGRLRYYRINPRGDRRYRIGDLHRFLSGLDAAGRPLPPGDDGRFADGRSPDGRSPDGRSPDGRSPDGRPPDHARRNGTTAPRATD